jgi:hypothetical protein
VGQSQIRYQLDAVSRVKRRISRHFRHSLRRAFEDPVLQSERGGRRRCRHFNGSRNYQHIRAATILSDAATVCGFRAGAAFWGVDLGGGETAA